MIYFKKIRWKNLLSTGNVWTEIDFDRSKNTLIVGENGAGKSTLLDALCFVLYGKAFRNINKPTLCNSINKKDCLVEVEFVSNSKSYLVRRGIKPAIFDIICDGELINQSSETKEYQEYFESHILGFNHKAFSQIVVLGSASFTPFMQLPAAHRREIIESLLDIQIFSTMNVLLKEMISDNKSQSAECDFQAKLIAEKIQMQKRYMNSVKENNDTYIEDKKNKLLEIESLKDKCISDNKNCNDKIVELTDSISDAVKLRSRDSALVKLESELLLKIRKTQQDITFLCDNENCPTCHQGIDHNFKDSSVAEKTDYVSKLSDGVDRINKERESLSVRLHEISGIEAKIKLLMEEYKVVQSSIQFHLRTINTIKQEIDQLSIKSDKIIADSSEMDSLLLQQEEVNLKKIDIQKDKQIFDVAAVILKDSGVKTRIIKQYIPIINTLVNKYLVDMGFFVNFELNDSFEETIKSRHRDDFTYESFSEGEKMRIDLAILFTWRAISKLRNSMATNLLIMDEVFDSSLDAAGTDEFLKIINSLTSDTNLFIISHKKDQLFDKFHSVIRFEKHKNFSRIVK